MAKARARIGNASPNRAPNIPKQTGGNKSVRVLRALSPFTYKTQQAGNPPRAALDFQHPERTKNQFYQGGRPVTRSRRNVRRLFRRDPYNKLSTDAPAPFGTGATSATMAKELDRISNNTNPMYQPMPSPKSVSVKRAPQAAAGTRNRGKVFGYSRFMQLGGKTLKRR